MIKNTNDGTNKEPNLRVDLNYLTCESLPSFSTGLTKDDQQRHEAIKDAGFGGIQDGKPELCKNLGLNYTAHARINKTGELDELVEKWKDSGYDCASLHVGWGLESNLEMDRLVEYVLNTSVSSNFPLFIETHRATITQDMQRTVELINRFPEIRFNGDFSHWYTGQEMVYGGIEMKWDFINPVFERVRFLHGRIGNPGCIQVDVQNTSDEFVLHFKEMWTRSFAGFLKSAQAGDYIAFTIELLESSIYYARTFRNEQGREVEEGDRWQQALLYKKLAEECWAEAKKRTKA